MQQRQTFKLDFAPHIGFPTPAQPLFSELAEGIGAEQQIAFACQQGFTRVQDPFATERSQAQQKSIGQAAKASGIGLGCFVYAPMSAAKQPAWSTTSAAARRSLEQSIDGAIAVGETIGSRHIAILTGSEPGRAKADQIHAMTDNLARMADRAAAKGFMLCVEAVSSYRLPQMLLHHYSDAVEVVRNAAHPAVRLIFDTAHVQAMDGDILGNLDRTWDLVEVIQLADHPGRVEPGAGELNFLRIVDEIVDRKFAGPVELEHLWSAPGRPPQARYLEWLSRWKCKQGRE